MTDESIAAEPAPISEPGLQRAIERMRAQVQWLRHGKLFENCPNMAVDDMEAMLRVLASPKVLRASSGSLSEADIPTTLLTRLDEPDEVKRALNNAYYLISERGEEDGPHDAVGNCVLHEILRARAALSPSGPMISLNAVAAEPRSPSPALSTRNTQGWQPISTAPKSHPILLTNGDVVSEGYWLSAEPYIRERRDGDGHYLGQDESDGFDGFIDYSGGMLPEATHWMPLPRAPQSDFRVLKRDEGPTADAATGTGNTQGTEP